MSKFFYTPVLKFCTEQDGKVRTYDYKQAWGSYDTKQEAESCFPKILNDLHKFPVGSGHFHTFSILVEDPIGWSVNSMIDVVPNIELICEVEEVLKNANR